MATLNISLPDTMKNFVEEEVTAGGYNTTSEYFRTLVRDAQERKAKARLETLLLESMNGGDATMTEADWEEVRREIRERVTRRKLEELRQDVRHGFEQIERGEYTEYNSGKEVADKIIAEGLKRVAERKQVEA